MIHHRSLLTAAFCLNPNSRKQLSKTNFCSSSRHSRISSILLSDSESYQENRKTIKHTHRLKGYIRHNSILNMSSNEGGDIVLTTVTASSKNEAITSLLSKVPKTTPCGELACQYDSFQSELSTESIAAFVPYFHNDSELNPKQSKQNTNASKNQIHNHPPKNDSTQSKITYYAIILTNSIFFPEGGGQPSDDGIIHLPETNIDLEVIQAQNTNETCILITKASSTSENIPPQTIIDALDQSEKQKSPILQKLNFEKRFDYMTQHSAQHLISAVALSTFDLQTNSFSLNKNPTMLNYIDFAIPDSAVKNDINFFINVMSQIEQQVNQHIRSDLSMKPMWVTPSHELFQTNQVRSRLLPQSFKDHNESNQIEPTIRLVRIGDDLDLNTCCGTHVPNLSHLQMIKFFKVEKFKSTVLRVYFASSKRLLSILDSVIERQLKLSTIMSCMEEEQISRVESLMEDKKMKERELKTMKEKLGTFMADSMVEEINSKNMLVLYLDDVFDHNYLQLLSNSVWEKIGSDSNKILLLVCGVQNAPLMSDEGSFLLTGDKSIVDSIGKDVAILFSGRGGGKNGRFQGKGSKVRSGLEAAKELILNKMKSG